MESKLSIDLARLVRLWRALIDKRLKPLGLTQTLWITMHNIHKLSHKQSQTKLAKIIGIEQPSLVRTLDQLEKKGLIIRTCSPDDRRTKLITLTDESKVIFEQVENILENIRVEILSGLNESELDIFSKILMKVEDNINELQKK